MEREHKHEQKREATTESQPKPFYHPRLKPTQKRDLSVLGTGLLIGLAIHSAMGIAQASQGDYETSIRINSDADDLARQKGLSQDQMDACRKKATRQTYANYTLADVLASPIIGMTINQTDPHGLMRERYNHLLLQAATHKMNCVVEAPCIKKAETEEQSESQQP